MREYKINKNILNYVLLTAIFISMFAFIMWNYEWANFNSDSAVKVLLAQEMFITKSFFPRTWIYFNNDLMILYGNTLIYLFLHKISFGYILHAISGVIFIILFFSGTWLLIGRTSATKNQKLFSLSIVGSGISLTITEQIWAQTGNGIVYLCMCITAYITCRIIFPKKDETVKIYHYIALCLFVFITSWSNPSRALFFYITPILITLITVYIRNENLKKYISKKLVKFFIFLIAGYIVGIYFHKKTLNSTQMNEGYAKLLWLSLNDTTIKIIQLPIRIISLIGIDVVPGSMILSIQGLYEIVKILAAICSVMLIGIAVIRNLSQKNIGNYFVNLYFLVGFIQIVFITLFTTINHRNYLTPILTIGIALLALTKFDDEKSKVLEKIRLLTLLIIMTNSIVIHTKIWGSFHSLDPLVTSYGDFKRVDTLINFLKKNNLKYGYSTFWRAGRLTVLSNDEVKVRSIEIKNGVILPDLRMSSLTWYDPKKYNGNSFLILNELESNSINWEKLKDKGLRIHDIISFENLKIYIFSENISKFF